MHLVRPTAEHLPSYIDALERGWAPDNTRGAAAAEELARIQADPVAFLAGLDDFEGKGPPVTLPNGHLVHRIPSFRRWIWDGEFAGSLVFRWQHGTTALPPHTQGYIGYAVVPWKQGQGYAKAALKLLLQEAVATGLPFADAMTGPDNVASQRVIEAAGGVLHERFTRRTPFGGREVMRFRFTLA